MVSFKNITNPSKWSLSSPSEVGDFILDPLNLSRGDEAAAEQEAAANEVLKQQERESDSARKFLEEQAAQGQVFIDDGARKAAGSLYDYSAEGRSALNRGYQNADASIDKGQNKLAALMDGGLARSFSYDPGFRERLGAGSAALEKYAGKAGLSGSNLAALMSNNHGMATQEFQNYQNRQTGLGQQMAGMDSSMANSAAAHGGALAQSNDALGSQLAQLYTGQGVGKANIGIGSSTQNNAISQSIIGAMNNPVQYAGGEYAGQMQGLQNGVSIAGSIFGFCDINLKKEIAPADDIIDEVLEVLQPYSYGYYDEKHGKGRFVGIMAQDAEKAQAGKWLIDDTPEGKVIDMRKAMGLALAAAAYERKQRLALEARIAALEAK